MADGSTQSIGGVSIEILAGQGKFNRSLVQAEQRARATGSVMVREFDRADRSAERLNQTLKRGVSALALFGGGFTAGLIAKSVIEAADAMTLLRGRISNVITETESLSRVQRDLYNSAQNNRVSLEAQAQLYLRLRQSVSSLTHEMALSITDTFAQTLVLSGASASEAASSMLQFAQAMSKGKLDGDELKSILENNSRFAKLLGDALGVTKGQLRDLGEAGALTGDLITRAMGDKSAEVAAEFSNIPLTVGQAMTKLENALINYIGETDSALGISARLAAGIDLLATNLDGLLDVLLALGSGAIAGGATFGLLKVGDAAFRMGLAIKEALSNIAAGTNPAYKKFAEPVTKAVLDAERALINYQTSLAGVTRAEKALADAQAAGNTGRSLAAYKGQVTRARNLTTSLQEASDQAGRTADQMQKDFTRATSAIGSRVSQIATIAGRMGSALLDAFGGPVGLAIAAASIAMAVFTHNALKAAEAARNVQQALELVADLQLKVADAASSGATAIDDATAALKRQEAQTKLNEDAVNALAIVREREARAIIAAALAETRRQANESQRKVNSLTPYLDVTNLPDARRKRIESEIAAAREELTRLNREGGIFERALDGIDKGLYEFGKSAEDTTKPIDAMAEALKRFQDVVKMQRGANTAPAFKSELIKNALGALAETPEGGLAAARKEFEGVKDLLTQADAVAVEKNFRTIARATVELKSALQEFRTPAEQFKKAIDEIRKADPSEGNKSKAAAQAVIEYGRELANIPAAMKAIEDLGPLLKPEDAQAARDEIGKIARDAGRAFGTDAQKAAYGYAESLKAINDAEGALKATGQAYDPEQFNAARAILTQEYQDATRSFTLDLEDLANLIEEMRTPTEKLNEELAELGFLRAGEAEGSAGAIAADRKRVQLLEEEARAAGYAGKALAELKRIQNGTGYTKAELKGIRERITSAAGEGYAAGNRPADAMGKQRADGEAASRLFAQTFTEALTAGIRSGNFGEALRTTIANAAANALTEAITNIGKWAGDALFGEGGLMGDVAGLISPETIGNSAKAAAEGAAVASLTALATTTAATTAAETAASATAVTAMVALTTAATAASAALTAMAVQEGAKGVGSTIASLFGTGIPGNAHGGKGFAGQPMIVGETGKRELFIPGADGYVVPNSALMGTTGVHGSASSRSIGNLRMGDTYIAGDVGTHDMLRQMQRQQEAEARLLMRKIKSTVLEMERRGQ
jgi:tape measure domain-containing protein